jgi:hypothetical protein
MADINKDKKGTNYTLLVVFSIIVVLLYAGSWYYIDSTYTGLDARGQFGDKFGAVNALFSGLAFAGLIFTIILQKNELALQRKELSLTHEELKGQKEQLEEQNKTLKIQRFENTFFNMLSQFQEVVSGITYTLDFGEKTKVYKGRELFYEGFENLEVKIREEGSFVENSRFDTLRECIEKEGLQGYASVEMPTYFDHYFRLLYRILKFVEKTDLQESDKEKYVYTSMIRAILSRYELVWLYYNGLSAYGNKKLKPLIEKFCMLKNLRTELLCYSNDSDIELHRLGLTADALRANCFSGTDYENFLTTEKNSRTRYNLSAFYTEENMEEGVDLLKKWQSFLTDKQREINSHAT